MTKKFSINDPIHNRITLTEIEQSVINHPIYQRLRRIKALGLLEKVFPSARHSRFEHSIGACHIVGLILTSLLENQKEISDLSKWKSENFNIWSGLQSFLNAQRVQQIRLAALLHDIGHGPFSHASEGIMPNREELISQNSLPKYVTAALNKRKTEKGSKVDHEDYSLIVAWKLLSDISILHGELNDNYIQDVLSLKFSFVTPSNPINEDKFSLFRNFVDGEFDSDRMDYLLRDSYFCGVPYGKFDLPRLLEGLYILEEKSSNKLVLALKKSSLSAFEDFLFARFQMHSQVYSHRVDVAFNSALKTLSLSLNKQLPANLEKYIEIDDENFLTHPHIEASEDLKKLILNREKWSLVYETSSSDDRIPELLFQELQEKYGKSSCSLKKSTKEISNEEVLKIPIVIMDSNGDFLTEKLERIALILKSYKNSFFAKRVFVPPEIFKESLSLLKNISVGKLKSIEKTNKDIAALEKAEAESKPKIKANQ